MYLIYRALPTSSNISPRGIPVPQSASMELPRGLLANEGSPPQKTSNACIAIVLTLRQPRRRQREDQTSEDVDVWPYKKRKKTKEEARLVQSNLYKKRRDRDKYKFPTFHL